MNGERTRLERARWAHLAQRRRRRGLLATSLPHTPA